MEVIPLDFQLIPTEAFRYWPSVEEISTGQGKKTSRNIFYNTTLSQFELDQINIFKLEILFKLPEFFSD